MFNPRSRRDLPAAGLAVAMAMTASAAAAAPSETDSVMVGPWKVEALSRNAKFLSCAMSRTTQDEVEVKLSRDSQGLLLRMASPKWRLGHGKSYPVDLVAGNLDEQAEVSANGDAVSLRLTDEEFVGKLAQENELDVKGAGSTIKVALDGSAAALERLNSCYDKNAKNSTEANPFVAPKQKP